MAIVKFETLVKIQLQTVGQRPRSYIDVHTALEMIRILSELFRKRLRDRLKHTPYYGIMVDETTDKATEQQLIIYIKYLDRDELGDIKVVVEFLDLVVPVKKGRDGSKSRVASQGLHVEWVMNVVAS